MDSFIEALKNLNTQGGRFNSVLVRGVLEGFMDGILILTQQGECVHINSNAQHIIKLFARNESQFYKIGQEIKRVYQAVIDSCELYPDTPTVVESEVNHDESTSLRIRARWLQLEADEQSFVLILLEDQKHSIHRLAITEAQKYGLTPREAEIWLLRRANHSYKDIAAELFISLNTVKKHVKNIRSKLKFYQFRQEDSIAS